MSAPVPSPAADAGGPRLPPRFFVIKHGDTFMVADGYGDVGGEGDGLFSNDTRILSRFRLSLGGRTPSLLASDVSGDNVFFIAHITNRPLPPLGGNPTPEGVIHLARRRFLWEGRLYECMALTNYGARPAVVPLELDFAADFRDMFEVRGARRAARGELLPSEYRDDCVILRYRGLDDMLRSTAIAFSQRPARLQPGRAEFELSIAARGRCELYLEIGEEAAAAPGRPRFRAAAARACASMRAQRRRGASVRASTRLFNAWVEKSRADLALLTTALPTGPFPYAGVPWFSTPFGRDAVITALATLWLDPALARGVLRFLAANQARGTSPFQESAPGKILHETRKGEMTRLRELPFGQYYGGVDTTPLFVVLAGAYADRTGDMGLIEELWPALEAAVAWIQGDGDSNRDGFVDYMPGGPGGLVNQGWKDSSDSIFHHDGSDAAGPIALVEVQGYAFAALRAMATLAGMRGDHGASEAWRRRAEALRAAVEARFWLEDLRCYALALDGNGAPCRVRASNQGHLLYVGLPLPERAAAVAAQFAAAAFDTGWGIRTLSRDEVRFNPMSYHNGSVWPHDTALCAAGLARYGHRASALRFLDGLFEAAVHLGMRLPELFCGFDRVPGQAPTAYPVACLPQAWAAASVFMMLQAVLGLRVCGHRGEIHVDRPGLPPGIDQIDIRGLEVGGRRASLTFQRVGGRVAVYPMSAESVPIYVRA